MRVSRFRACLGPDGKPLAWTTRVIVLMKTIRVMSRPSEACINFPTKCRITVFDYHCGRRMCDRPVASVEKVTKRILSGNLCRRAGASAGKDPFSTGAPYWKQSRFAVFKGLGVQVLSAVTAKTDWGRQRPQGLDGYLRWR